MFYLPPYIANTGQGELAGLCLGNIKGGMGAMMPALAYCQLFPRGGKCKYIASLHPRPSVRDEEPHVTAGVSVLNTADLQE
jgi:hypothetical protein